jgi:outer membrane protein assembly factor BamB
MSTDTDYVIAVKGKDAALRKAAADFIELALNPWNPQRNDKKTLTRLDVFRNESKSAGFFTPSSLCEEAAKLFPGVSVSFSSKNEYGYTEDGQWTESGEPPKDTQNTVATKVLERVRAEVEQLQNRVEWLEPLAGWASGNGAPKKTCEAILGALAEAEQAKKEVTAALEAEAEKENEKEIEAVKKLESMTRWRFHPVLTVESELIGKLEKPILWRCRNGWLDDEETEWGDVWEPCESGDVARMLDQAVEDGCESLAIGSPVTPTSKAVSKFLESQVHESLEQGHSSRIFVRDDKGVVTVTAKILKHVASFVWLHSVKHLSDPAFKAGAKQAMRLSESLDGATLWKISDETALRSDKYGFGQDIEGCLVLSESHAFVATRNALDRDSPSGRVFCVSLNDGSATWISSRTFFDCRALVASDESTLLAVCIGSDRIACLVCFDSATGKDRWHAPIQLSDRYFTVTASPEIAVLLSYKTNEASISWWRISSGEKLVEHRLTDAWNQPELAMDTLRTYVAGKSSVTAFGPEGENLWTVHLPECDSTEICLTGNNTIVVSRGNQGVVCMHCENGATAWTVAQDEAWAAFSSVGENDLGFFGSPGVCAARDLRSGSLRWKIETGDESSSAKPLVITSEAVLLKIGYSRYEWFGLSDGTKLGAFGLCTAGNGSGHADGVMAGNGLLACLGSPLQDTLQLVCVDLGIGSPSGVWPMSRQGPGGASFLRIKEKTGYKKFIKAWKDGEDLSPQLAKFTPAPDSDKAREARIHGIIRGHELIAQARSWVEPSIGSGKTATARGAQWRLVMAYGGFELLAKSLAGAKDRGLDDKAVDLLIGKLALPVFEPLAPPPIEKSTLKEWMDEEDASDVLDFLKMDKGDRNRFDAWLAKQKALTTWTDALLLAKAFRNATAHGALSPRQLEEWKLGEGVSRLTEEIFRVDEAVFDVLGKS